MRNGQGINRVITIHPLGNTYSCKMFHGYLLKMFYIISPHYFSLQFAGIEGTVEVQELRKLPWMLFGLCRSILKTQRHYYIQITAFEFSAATHADRVHIYSKYRDVLT